MMTITNRIKRMKTGIIAGLCAAFFGVAAQAGVYTTFTTSSTDEPGNVIPTGYFVDSKNYFALGSQINLSTQTLPPIYNIELTLTFAAGDELYADGSGIQGQLTLGTGANSPYVAFNPVETYTDVNGNSVYDVNFSNFNGLSPDNTWSLILWDNNSKYSNQLVDWSLTVEVPEPVDVALVVFGLMFVAILVTRWHRARKLAGSRPA
jgi:hypothetical protein